MNYLSQASEGVQYLAGIVLALYALTSSLSLLLGFVGSFWPPALVWARQCSNVGLRLHNFGTWLGSLLPGGKSPVSAQLESLRPKPLPNICASCGSSIKGDPK